MKLIIVFSRPKKFKLFSWLITKIEGTKFSHVSVKFKSDKFNRVLVYQASHLRVNFFEGSNFDLQNETLHEFVIEMNEKSYTDLITFAIDNAGMPYGMTQIIGILYIKLFNLLGIKVSNPFLNGRKEYICSEIVAEILNKYADLTFKSDLDTITPKMLFDIMSSTTKV